MQGQFYQNRDTGGWSVVMRASGFHPKIALFATSTSEMRADTELIQWLAKMGQR